MRAVLYLHQCEPEHAQSALFSIPKVGMCVKNKKCVGFRGARLILFHCIGSFDVNDHTQGFHKET